MKQKDKILSELKSLTESLDGYTQIGIAAADLAECLGIQRNVASHLLNELSTEGHAIKINTRPVYFLHRSVYEDMPNRFSKADKYLQWQPESTKTTPVTPSETVVSTPQTEQQGALSFHHLVGFNGSLREIVEQCKSAVHYPPNGLPILLVGSSGVGKSYLAQLISEYAHSTGVLETHAPFVVFNCAEYANNAELLTAALFGYCKGAFTGADKDKTGVIEEANGGLLFLDEVHRLTAEGQEKLFLFLDKGVYRRMGESGPWREANVRLICATTEIPEQCMLPTFLRRIPLILRIPTFQDRPLKERLAMVHAFYEKEALRLDRDLIVSGQAVNLLIRSKASGNIGQLTNAIKLSCANAFKSSFNDGSKSLKINITHLPTDYMNHFEGALLDTLGCDELRFLRHSQTSIIHETVSTDKIRVHSEALAKLTPLITANVADRKQTDSQTNTFFREAFDVMNEFLDDLQFTDILSRRTHTVIRNAIEKLIQHGIQNTEVHYGLKYSGNSVEVLSQLIAVFTEYPYEDEWYGTETLYQELKLRLPKEWSVVTRLTEMVEKNLDLQVHPLMTLFGSLYLRSLNRAQNDTRAHGVIVAHGYTTASSIASVANRILGQYIFDAFDMPLELTAVEIGKKLSAYIETIDSSKGIVILVDMGSLEGLYKGIDQTFFGDIALINNVSTQLALDVGYKIISHMPIEEIASSSVTETRFKYHYRPAELIKPSAIVTTCNTGIGTASKIKSLLEKCFAGPELKIIAHDFDKLVDLGRSDGIFKQYDVKLIIGTMNPKLDGVPYVSLENLIMQRSDAVLTDTLSAHVSIERLGEFNREVLKLFSLENVLNYLTILNPDKIIDQVDNALNLLEKHLNIKLQNDHRISLTIHLCCMIERLVMKNPLEMSPRFAQFEDKYRDFVKSIKKAFEPVEAFYRIEIPIAEIGIIHENLSHRVVLNEA